MVNKEGAGGWEDKAGAPPLPSLATKRRPSFVRKKGQKKKAFFLAFFPACFCANVSGGSRHDERQTCCEGDEKCWACGTRARGGVPNTKGYSSTYLAMGFANVRAGTWCTRVPFGRTKAGGPRACCRAPQAEGTARNFNQRVHAIVRALMLQGASTRLAPLRVIRQKDFGEHLFWAMCAPGYPRSE